MGREEGRQQGRQEGIKVGKRSNSLYIATKLIERNMDFKDIAEITNLSIKKINDLSSDLNLSKIKVKK